MYCLLYSLIYSFKVEIQPQDKLALNKRSYVYYKVPKLSRSNCVKIRRNCLPNLKIFSNLAAILVFSMQTRICQRPHFSTSLRASEVSLIAQAIVLYTDINNMNVDYFSFSNHSYSSNQIL
jgi:hypothetical protein